MMEGILEDLDKWESLVNTLRDDEKKLSELKNHYIVRESSILNNTDFKKLYGANNDKVRNAHVKKVLKNTLNDKKNLELKIDDSKRMISFLKARVNARVELVKAGVKEM